MDSVMKALKHVFGMALVALVLSAAFAGSTRAYVHYETDPAKPENKTACESGNALACSAQPVRWWKDELLFTISNFAPPGLSKEEIRTLAESCYETWTSVDCESSPTALGKVPEVHFSGYKDEARSTVPTSLPVETDNLIVFVEKKSDWTGQNGPQAGHPSSYIAITNLVYDYISGEIYDADIEINSAFYDFAFGDEVGPGQVDFRAMLTHEMGHFYGLDHSDRASATMYATYSQASADPQSGQTLDVDDEDGICALYQPRTESQNKPKGDDGGCQGGGAGSFPWIFALAMVFFAKNRKRSAHLPFLG